ncbi:MAG: aspartate/glutamate racemase family protein, partial [Firmicutes bacterium]|nr:aspartate/glutamate racemase family protein [Bacillota bacterium]
MKTLGIIGGMGPSATYDLAQKIVDRTEAAKDQDHIRVFTDCNTNIPDRTAAILYGGADPLPAMTDSARKL